VPRKVFVSGEILTASDVNVNLMDQAVQVFDDSAARGSAIPSPIEGMVTYLKDTDAVEKFDGSAYRSVGGLVAVKSALFTGTQVVSSVSGGANFAVTDLSITHEVANPANKLIISAFFGAAAHTEGLGNVGIAIHDGSGLIAVGDTAGSRSRVSAGGNNQGTGVANSNTVVGKPSITFVHTPGAGSKTYTVRAISISDSVHTLYINRTQIDGDAAERPRAVSSLVIQEVSV
jgi:hypothetical protein